VLMVIWTKYCDRPYRRTELTQRESFFSWELPQGKGQPLNFNVNGAVKEWCPRGSP